MFGCLGYKKSLRCQKTRPFLCGLSSVFIPHQNRRGSRFGVDGGFEVVFYCRVLLFLFIFNDLHESFKKSCSTRVLLKSSVNIGDRNSVEQ